MSASEPQGQTHEDANIQRLCRLGGVSRAGYYRCFMTNQPARADADMRDHIQRISLAHRHYGYRRIAAELRREGHIVNAKRVLRLMREDNLLCLRAKPFVPHTTDSRHGFAVVPNLTRGLIPRASIRYGSPTSPTSGSARASSIWPSCSTPTPARWWAGRSTIIWRPGSRSQALDMAIVARDPPPDSLIHHSDRGVQYACGDYSQRLEARQIAASMSRAANPYDNAKAESFMKTLKAEEVNAKTYATLEDARRQIGAFIETVYNADRLHSALGYKPPAEFEAERRGAT